MVSDQSFVNFSQPLGAYDPAAPCDADQRFYRPLFHKVIDVPEFVTEAKPVLLDGRKFHPNAIQDLPNEKTTLQRPDGHRLMERCCRIHSSVKKDTPTMKRSGGSFYWKEQNGWRLL
jgi:hypothetical protein